MQHPIEIVDKPESFLAYRRMRSPWVSGFYDLLFGPQNKFGGSHVSKTQTVFHSPAYIRTNSGVIHEIEGQAVVDQSVFGEVRFHHVITPETSASTDYFSSVSRNYRLRDDDFSTALKKIDHNMRMQDVVAAGELENRLSRDPPQGPELLARSEAAALRIRKRSQQLLDAEAGQSASLARESGLRAS